MNYQRQLVTFLIVLGASFFVQAYAQTIQLGQDTFQTGNENYFVVKHRSKILISSEDSITYFLTDKKYSHLLKLNNEDLEELVTFDSIRVSARTLGKKTNGLM